MDIKDLELLIGREIEEIDDKSFLWESELHNIIMRDSFFNNYNRIILNSFVMRILENGYNITHYTPIEDASDLDIYVSTYYQRVIDLAENNIIEKIKVRDKWLKQEYGTLVMNFVRVNIDISTWFK